VLEVSLRGALSVPESDILEYPKLARAILALLEILFRNHIDSISSLSTDLFIQILNLTHMGLQSSDASICALCAGVIDHMATYYFLNIRKNKPAALQISEHLQSDSDITNQIMNTLFTQLLFSSHSNHWAVTRPILSLMLASEDSFDFARV